MRLALAPALAVAVAVALALALALTLTLILTSSLTRCGFGQPSGCDPWPATGASVLATLRDPSTLVCASPSRETAGADEPVTVALNGQCFEGGAAHASFRFLPPLVPNGSFPSSGAVTGGAAVRVLGAGMLDVDAVS